MPVKHHVALDRARKTAKTLSREGGITHQQALDQVAREAGFPHWNAMSSATPVAAIPTQPLLTAPSGAEEPDRGYSPLHFELDDFPYLRAPGVPQPGDDVPTLRDVERQTMEIMARPAKRTGLGLSKWISGIMHETASRAIKAGPSGYGYRTRELPLDARMVAEALDPEGAPHRGDSITARCPLHDDASGSLRITGTGRNLRMACMAGCLATDLQDRLLARLASEHAAAVSFMHDNDRSKVVGGSGHGKPGVGGAGGSYLLADGQNHSLNILACRLLLDGYPDWYDGKVPRSIATLERTLRSALAGRLPIAVEAPEDRMKGLWRFVVDTGNRYHILLSMQQGQRPGINATHDGAFSVVAAETFATARKAVDRVVELTRSFETVDPAERSAAEAQYAREIARNERVRGTVDGWGWWAGPNPDEMTYGGPYKTKADAISNGNGSCMEQGEYFYVVQARTDGEGEGVLDDDLVAFTQTRGLERKRATR